jgi:RING finger/CHY zinc finger protein 1
MANTDAEEDRPSAEDKEEETKDQAQGGCHHYKRKCKFYTPCCRKTYQCRFCHDTNESHVLQRDDVTKVVFQLWTQTGGGTAMRKL